MIAIQSHFSINGKFLPHKKHLFLNTLSCVATKQLFGKIIIFTDKESKKFFDWLPYDEVIVCDNKIPTGMSHNPLFGKMQAYYEIDKPFFHIDTDAIQWKPLPNHIANSKAFCLAYTEIPSTSMVCGCNIFANANFKIVSELQNAISKIPHIHPSHGLIGGNNYKSFNEAAKQIFKIVEDNGDIWKNYCWWQLGMNMEEFCLSEILTKLNGERPPALMKNWNEGDLVGHTHLTGQSKWHDKYLGRVERKLRKKFPYYYNLAKERFKSY